MRTLNLVNQETSHVKWKVSNFPDGQRNIVFDMDSVIRIPTLIKTRLNNWADLEILTCAVASLRGAGVDCIHAYIPYFLGSRSDRKFEKGGNNYLKDVICPVINSLKFSKVTVLDPHSDVLEACLNNFEKQSNEDFVKWSLSEIYDYDSDEGNSRMIMVSPDGGALKKIYSIAEAIEFEGDIITCSKSRDIKGKLTKIEVPMVASFKDFQKDLIIIDDICDGGNTFVNICKAAVNQGFNGKKYLIVTHGIFSKGFEELRKYFDGIYTTDSYSQYDPETYITQDSLVKIKDLVKQMDVF